MLRFSIPLLSLLLFLSCKTIPNHPDVFEKILWATAFSPDGKWLAVGGNAGEVWLYSTDDFAIKKRFPIPLTATKFAWHPKRDLLCVGAQSGGGSLYFINTKTDEIKPLEKAGTDGVRAIAWNPRGDRLAVGENEGLLMFFDEFGELMTKEKVEPKGFMDLSWHPDGKRLVLVGSKIWLLDVPEKDLETFPSRADEILMLSTAWHPSSDVFATADYGDFEKPLPPLLQFWDKNGQLLFSSSKSKGPYRNIEWSPDGSVLATASDQLRLWSKEGKLLQSTSVGSQLWGLSWNPDGNMIAVTTGTGEVYVFDENLKKKRCLVCP